ncbi:hypothetical protein EQG49_11120 [Periweissella cryptocerci]|uniref:Uncharacterized protein n=1 Tax=Periweissella cryptocerci TaxID=2506420 RepID=A0A4P6YW43_9LACO|nr:hypothetical protein [Periweissella cryptocerci]QBO36957.1 hypothetical protein EQG49_11120 [Periweissella cryptocerci]
MGETLTEVITNKLIDIVDNERLLLRDMYLHEPLKLVQHQDGKWYVRHTFKNIYGSYDEPFMEAKDEN